MKRSSHKITRRAYQLDQRGRRLYAYKRRWANRFHMVMAILTVVGIFQLKGFTDQFIPEDHPFLWAQENGVTIDTVNTRDNTPISYVLGYNDEDALWIARTAWGEVMDSGMDQDDMLKQTDLISWVVRNRVETRWRGATTVLDVVKAPAQFTPWQVPRLYRKMMRMRLATPEYEHPMWPGFLSVAKRVLATPREDAPYPITTRHYNHSYATASWIPNIPTITIEGDGSYELEGHAGIE